MLLACVIFAVREFAAVCEVVATVPVEEHNVELEVVPIVLVVTKGLLSPRPLTSPLCVKDAKDAGRLGGRVKLPKPKGLYNKPGAGYKNGNEVADGIVVVELLIFEVEVEDAGSVLLRGVLLVLSTLFSPLLLLSPSLFGSFEEDEAEGMLEFPIGGVLWRPWKLKPGNPKRGFASPMPARPPKGKNMGGVEALAGEVEVVVVVAELAFAESMKNFILGNPVNMPALAKLRGFKPAAEEKGIVVGGGGTIF